MAWLWKFGSTLKRMLGRTQEGIDALKAPPRTIRRSPVFGPVGSVTGSGAYSPSQSLVHSHTFPTTSNKPYLDLPSGNEPTGAVVGNPSSSEYIPLPRKPMSTPFFAPQARHSLPHAFM